MEIDTPFVHLRIKDDVLVGTYKKDLRINLEIAKEIVRTRLSFTGGRKLPSIILSEGLISIDKAAREFLVSEEGTEGLTVCAIIVDSSFSRFLGNFFMKVNKTKMPVKMFSDISKAERWLQQFVT